MGALDPRWAGGRPRRISAEDEAFLIETATTGPGGLGQPFTHWSLRKLVGTWPTTRGESRGPGRAGAPAAGRPRDHFQRTKTWKESPDPDRRERPGPAARTHPVTWVPRSCRCSPCSATISTQIATDLGLNATDGVIVAVVAPGDPVDRAGLVPGDVIVAVDGESTATPEDLLAALRRHDPGDTVSVSAHGPRQDDRQVQLTFTDRPLVVSAE
jgi:membrane-associated protease RseP (regulator of RpoE activity)